MSLSKGFRGDETLLDVPLTLTPVTRVLVRAQKGDSEGEAEGGGMWPQAKERLQPPEAGRRAPLEFPQALLTSRLQTPGQ